MPRGTFWAAPTVSSAACAEASNPVIVYAGRTQPSTNNQVRFALAGQTAPPAVPL